MKRNYENIQIDKLKGVLITRTAIKTLIDEDIVEKVISFQFKDVKEMVHEYQEIEVTGFGKFMISGRKLRNKLAKMLNTIALLEKRIGEAGDTENPEKIRLWHIYLQQARNALKFLEEKLKEYEDKH